MNGGQIQDLIQTSALSLSKSLYAEISECAVQYCAAPNTPEHTIEECVEFVTHKFSRLCPAEIREAFRMAAAKETGADLNAYHGQFSVRILGDVLSSYLDVRDQTYRRIRQQQWAVEQEQQENERAEMLRKSYGTVEDALHLWMQKSPFTAWDQVPEFYAIKIIQRGLMPMDNDEKGRAWVQAKHLAVSRLPAMIAAELNEWKRRRLISLKRFTDENPELFPEDLNPVARSIYAQILVFSKLQSDGKDQ